MHGMPDVAGIVLAAGAGRRFGMPKALVPYQGELLVERAAEMLAEGGCAPVVVVLGASADVVRSRAALGGATIVVNLDWPSGMGSSLRTALDTLGKNTREDDVSAALVVPVDMPGITAQAVRRVASHADAFALVSATHEGRRSHPVLLGREHWSGAAAASVGDSGARRYLQAHDLTLVACDDVSKGFDIDRPQDLGPA